ncbi:integral membrane protein [Paramyrothecium foliicola]|nr:integral membrane protein [Paramyrothecium foliicola]
MDFPTEVTWNEMPTLPIVQAHFIVVCVVVAIALIAVGLRVMIRITRHANFWWDDWLCFAAVPQGIAMLVIQGLYTKLGVGYDFPETILNMPLILRLLFAYEFIYSMCVSTLKLSMLFFYLRVFVTPGFRKITKLTMGFVLLWSSGNILQIFLICRPLRKKYDPVSPGVCGDQVASFIAIGAFNAVTDVLVLALPLKTVWSLQMKALAKIGITCVFALGLSVSIIALVRIESITRLDLNNLTGSMVDAVFWSAFEVNLAIICVSLPMLGPLWSSCTVRFKSQPQPSGPSAGSFSQGPKAFNRLHDSHEMDTIYGRNEEAPYSSEIHKTSAGVREDRGSLSGSETALAPEPMPSSKALGSSHNRHIA